MSKAIETKDYETLETALSKASLARVAAIGGPDWTAQEPANDTERLLLQMEARVVRLLQNPSPENNRQLAGVERGYKIALQSALADCGAQKALQGVKAFKDAALQELGTGKV